jgi:hypothetical protein
VIDVRSIDDAKTQQGSDVPSSFDILRAAPWTHCQNPLQHAGMFAFLLHLDRSMHDTIS